MTTRGRGRGRGSQVLSSRELLSKTRNQTLTLMFSLEAEKAPPHLWKAGTLRSDRKRQDQLLRRGKEPELEGHLDIFLYKVQEVSPPCGSRVPGAAPGRWARQRLSSVAQYKLVRRGHPLFI